MIVPSGWLTAREHIKIREFCLSFARPRIIIHLPYNVFPDAYIDTIIWISKKDEPNDISSTFDVSVKRYGHYEKVKHIPCNLSEYYKINGNHWLTEPQKLIVTNIGMGQWIGLWTQQSNFLPAGEILSISRGITPFTEPQIGETRSTFQGFFGSVGRYNLIPEKFADVVYHPSLMEYKPIRFFQAHGC